MKNLNKLGIQLGVVTIARTKIGTESPQHNLIIIINNNNILTAIMELLVLVV